MRVPSREVLEAFGARSTPVALRGGEGMAFQAGEVVLKRVDDAAEATWVQALLAGIEQDGFRVAAPVPTLDGGWVHAGWSACRFIDGLRPAAPRWNDVARWGLRFGDAAQRSRPSDAESLRRRTHRWAIADRVAWEDEAVDLGPEADEVRHALLALLMPGRTSGDHVVGASRIAKPLDAKPPGRCIDRMALPGARLLEGPTLGDCQVPTATPR